MTRPPRLIGPLLAGILLVAGTALPHAGAARVGAAPIVVDYWQNLCWEPAKTDLQYMAAAFNKSHPGIVIKPTCFSNANVLQPRLLAAIQAQHPPALSQTDAFAVATYVDEHAVQDLTPYIHGPSGWTNAELGTFFKPMMLNGYYRGGIYSLPFNDTSVTVLWYNPKLLKGAGIAHPPATWAELAADCARVTKGGNWCFDTTDNEEPLWEAMVLQWGGKLVNAAGTKAAFTTPAGVGALQYWIPLVKKGYVHHTNSSTSQWAQDFGSGHVAFEAYSSAGAHSVIDAIGTKFTLGAAPLPAGPVSNVVGNAGDNIFIFKDAAPAVKQAAWQYIKFVTSPKWTAWWAEQVHTTPVRTTAVPLMASYLKTDPTAAVAISELDRAYFSPTVSGWAQVQSDVDTEMSKAMLGQKSAAQAIKDAARAVDHDIATAP